MLDMVLLLGIVIGIVCGIVAAKKGLYSSWAVFVNITVAVYLAVFLTPTVFAAIGSLAELAYTVAASLAAIAVITFSIFWAITVIFFTGQFTFTFPKTFNTIGGGIVGFASGLLVWGFVALVFLAVPIWQNSFLQELNLQNQLVRTVNVSVVKACNCVNFLSRQRGECSTKEVVEWVVYEDGDKSGAESGQ